MSMCELIAAPAVGPNPGTTFNTPFGIPAFKKQKYLVKVQTNHHAKA